MKVLEERRIVWDESNDRTILIIKKGDDIIGLNFCQGEVGLDWFKVYYDDIDKDLTDFYNAVGVYLGGHSEFDRINQAMWAHLEYRNLKDARQ